MTVNTPLTLINHDKRKNSAMKYTGYISAFFILSFIWGSCSPKNILLETDYFEYSIAGDGKNLYFTDKATGVDYLDTETISKCAYITVEGIIHEVTKVSLNENHLTMEFGDTGVKAALEVIHFKDRVTLKVASVTGQIESLTFLNVPLKLEGQSYEPFSACALSMNLFTHVRQVPALQTHLWATCYERFGMEEAEVTLVCLPPDEILAAIRDVMSKAKDIPLSTAGGAWAQQSKEGYGSYILNYGSLTEKTVDEWIEMCSDVGFKQIDNHGGREDFFKFGSFELDKKKWPEGWEHFKRINDRLHEAGISSIFHTYAFFIDKDSKYVTPIPNKSLDYYKSFTLAEALELGDNEVVVQESTKGISTVTGFHVSNSRTIRIGEELIEFNNVTENPPYKFTGCKRGANGTKTSTHKVDSKVYHLKEQFGRFVPGPETELFDKIAHETAEIVNKCNFDGIYFDAIDASDILGGEENFWYFGTKFLIKVAEHLNPVVGMEMSSMSHHWWHYRSRWQAWDTPRRGFKRFVDIHSAAIKTDEYEHGYWRGHTPLINKFAPLENGSLMLPLQLGWWSNFTWNPPNTERTFPDDIEYLCCKMIGNNAGLALLGGFQKNEIERNPAFKQLNAIIKQYEELRLKNYFGEEVKKLLRQPGDEYTLFQEENGDWNFTPISYEKHKVAGLDNSTTNWNVNNQFDSQPLILRIETLMSAKSYDDPNNILLTDLSDIREFSLKGAADGIMGTINISTEKMLESEASIAFSASSSGKSPREGSWICFEKNFDPWLNLGNNQALGVWIKGDGKGELLNLRLETPEQFSAGVRGDHFIKIDFTGWKYFELVEIESSKFSNYIWPGKEISPESVVKDLFVYKSYLHSVQFDKVNKLQFWYNNLPAGEEANILIGPVKALPLATGFIENPSVTIGNEKIVFPVRIESGMYLEFRSVDDCKLYGPNGEFLKKVKPEGTVPILKNGSNKILLSGNEPDVMNCRLQVTVISKGSPLKINN